MKENNIGKISILQSRLDTLSNNYNEYFDWLEKEFNIKIFDYQRKLMSYYIDKYPHLFYVRPRGCGKIQLWCNLMEKEFEEFCKELENETGES